MNNSDHDHLYTILRKTKTQREVSMNEQIRKGNVEVKAKGTGNEDKQKMYKLENDNESLKHETVPKNVGKEIQKLRTQKKLSQKLLAKELNCNVKDIMDIESGKALNNKKLINKIKRHLEKK